MTTDITELAQSLKAAAEKASGGDWVKESGDGWDAICSNDDQANSGFIIAHFVGPDSASNREFMQLANPANIRALVEALESKDKQIVELNTYRAHRVSACVNACEGISTENLINNVPLKEGLRGLNQRIRDADAKLEAAERRIAELESHTVTDWIEHDGKWRPDSLSTDELVYLKTRKQELKIPYPAGKVMGWMHTGGDMDVIAYKLASPQARTVTVKLPDIMPPEAAPAHYWGSGESMAYADGYNKSAADLKTSFALSCSSAGVNVEFE